MIAMFQYPNIATSPAVHKIQSEVFTSVSLSTIQTVMAVSSITAPISSLLTSFLIRRGYMTKRFASIGGMAILGLVGVLTVIYHRSLWFLGVLSGLMGWSGGMYVTSSLSILIDSFEGDQRRRVTGLQALAV
jgi:MFS family permease